MRVPFRWVRVCVCVGGDSPGCGAVRLQPRLEPEEVRVIINPFCFFFFFFKGRDEQKPTLLLFSSYLGFVQTPANPHTASRLVLFRKNVVPLPVIHDACVLCN